jgi:DNA-binding MarR family transcriptional regulator
LAGSNRGAVGATERQAERFAELFGAVYLAFHRRDAPRSELSGASRAVLLHLAMAGPLTVGEAAAHLKRAQSVVSEIVDRLASRGLLERETDPADRRRTLVWLTDSGHETLRLDRQVLSQDHLTRTMSTMPTAQVDAILSGLADLVGHAKPPSTS